MKRAGTGLRYAGGSSSYPLLVLLLLAFLLPCVCLLWFMTEAMRNERLAVRQRLLDVYTSALNMAMPEADAALQNSVRGVRNALSAEAVPGDLPGLLTRLNCDGVVVVKPDGTIAYPDSAVAPHDSPAASSSSWEDATRVDEIGLHALAASAYAKVAAEPAADPHTRARALQAQVRCLLRDRQSSAALAVLTGPLSEATYAAAQDSQGRLIQPNSWLLALETAGDRKDPRFMKILQQLTARLSDYHAWMPASQRLFIMETCERLAPGRNAFPTLQAERLARAWADAGDTTSLSLAETPVTLRQGIWVVRATPGGPSGATTQTLALYRTETLRTVLTKAIGRKLPEGLRVEVLAPGAARPQVPVHSAIRQDRSDPLVVGRFGDTLLPGWTASLYPAGDAYLYDEAGNRVSLYLWIGLLAITSVAAVVLLGGRFLLRQVRLTRLKNDLTATVTHELKTPISSMRVLVDSLRENPGCGEQQLQEYLDLIARENVRRVTRSGLCCVHTSVTGRFVSTCRTTASGFLRERASGSSSGSIRWTRACHARRAAAVWGSASWSSL